MMSPGWRTASFIYTPETGRGPDPGEGVYGAGVPTMLSTKVASGCGVISGGLREPEAGAFGAGVPGTLSMKVASGFSTRDGGLGGVEARGVTGGVAGASEIVAPSSGSGGWFGALSPFAGTPTP